MSPPLSLLFLLLMLHAAAATQTIHRPDYARDTGLPDSVLTKYEKSNWLYRQLMEKDPYYVVPQKFLSKAKEIDAKFGKKSGWVKPDVNAEKMDRNALPHQTHIRLSQPQQAQWATYRNPGLVPKKNLPKDDYAKRIFAANPYLNYLTGGNPLDPHMAAKSLEGGTRVGPKLDELRARLPEIESRVVKPLGRQIQPPLPWETYDGFIRRSSLIPKRLAPIPFLEKANARREAANKKFGQKNPPGFVHWPQVAPKYLRDAEKYALSNANHLNILANGGVRAAINTDNPSLNDATFKHYEQIEEFAARRTEFEKAEMMKDSQRIAEAFKWDRIKDKLKDTNNHIVAQLKAARQYLPEELKRQRAHLGQELKRMQTSHARYGQNEMHAERNRLFRREKVSTHPLDALWLSSMLLEKGMEGHWPHIDDKDNRHYGVPSPYSGGPYNPMQSTFQDHGPFRSWNPDQLSRKCIGSVYSHANSKDCFINKQWGASWGMKPQEHTLSHPAAYQITDGMQFSQEDRDKERRKWIKAGTSQHEIEQQMQKNWQEAEEFQYPQRWSAYRRDDMPPFEKPSDDQHTDRKNNVKKEDNPYAWAPRSSTFTALSQATAPRSKNWNLQYVQDYQYQAPKTIGAYIQRNKDPKKGKRPFVAPPPNLQVSPDFPKLDGDLRHPDPSGSGALDNPMAGLVYEAEHDLRNPRANYHKTYGSNPEGLHPTDPGIPDIIMEGRLVCYGDVGAVDAQISLLSETAAKDPTDPTKKTIEVHISSAFTDKDGRFKLATTMNFAPHKLRVDLFHQCKESRTEKMAGKGEAGTVSLPLKYGDRRVYDLGTIDSSDGEYKWKRVQREIEGTQYQGDGLMPDMARMRPCLKGMDVLACKEDIENDPNSGKSDLTNEENVVPGVNQLGMDRDVPQYVPNIVRY